MKRIICMAFACLTFLAFSSNRNLRADDVIFLSVLDDVPLMTGLYENQETAIYFDTPQGRIAKVSAEGTVTKASITAYYQTSLPALGWVLVQAEPDMIFERDGEFLQITENSNGTVRLVQFALTPKRP